MMSDHLTPAAPDASAPGMSDVLKLSGFEAAPYLVLSLYLNAEARTQELPAIRSRAHALLHQAREELERRWDELEHDVREAARRDLEECRAFTDQFVPRGACRGLALFSCAGREWQQHAALPRPVPDRYAWDQDPLVLPIVRLVEEYPRTGVILLDREQARLFASRLGELEELREVRDDIPGQVRGGGRFGGLQERRIERHVEDQVHRHLKHVAAEAREVFRSWPVTWLLVGGNTELFEDFRHCLVPELRDRWAKELEIAADAPLEQLRETVLAAEEDLNRGREAALLRQLYDEWRSNGYGVVGIDETLRAATRFAGTRPGRGADAGRRCGAPAAVPAL
jgi:peptide subunit release factor 1 (eRF1)